jgi:chromosome segregation ATPase
MTRVRENQGEAQTWLGDVTEAMGALRMRVKEVASMKPAVDLVRSEVERVTHAMGSVESRREFLDEMNKRLSDLSSTASRLDERTKGLHSRMETADQRFVALSLHAEEAARVEKVVPIVLQGVEDAEERVAEVGETISNLEARAQKTEALAERMRKMGEDLDQRQGALEAATEHLDRVSELRQEAAATAQDLSEETRKLTAALGSAEGRADRLSELSDQLEDRSGNLRFTEKRLAQFEEKLSRWELLETQLTRSLDQLNERQGTVDALQADIKHLFAMAERTVEGVRSISEAHQEIVHTRAALDDVLTRMRDVDETIDDLELRKRQIERAEERLARADALVIDIQSSLETLHGQKAFLDHVIEKAGSLTFQAKQAEALIDTLREERELTNRVRAAVADMRDQNLKAG